MSSDVDTTKTLENDSKVCCSQSNQTDTIVLFVKSQSNTATLMNNEYAKQIENLKIASISTYFISPIEFEFVNFDILATCISSPNQLSGIILTSTRCIDALAVCLENLSSTTDIVQNLSKLTFFTVGLTTKTYLFEKLKFDSIGHHTGNSELLAKFILSMKDTFDKPLLYPCSNIRSDSIFHFLNDKLAVKEIVCYKTIANQQIDDEFNQFKVYLKNCVQQIVDIGNQNFYKKLIIIFFSPSGVDNLIESLRKTLISDTELMNFLIVKFVAFGKLTASKILESDLDVWFVSSQPNAISLENSKPLYRVKLESWLNKNMKIKMSDNRTIIGIFLCTDSHRNIILGSSMEYLTDDENEEPRVLGLAMIPGPHIVSIHVDEIVPT